MKSALRIALLIVLVLIVAMPNVFAEDNKINVQLDGDYVDLSTDAVIQNGRTLVPFRSIFEAMGMEVSWDPASKTVTGKDQFTEIKLTIGSNVATVNGVAQTLDVAVINTDGHTMIPLRFVSEAVGNYVDWKNTVNEVHIWGIDQAAVDTFKKIAEVDLNWNAIAVGLSGNYRSGDTLAGELISALSASDPQMQMSWTEVKNYNESILNLYYMDGHLRRNISQADLQTPISLDEMTLKSKILDIKNLDISEDVLRGAVLNKSTSSTTVTLVLDAKAAYDALNLSIFGVDNLFANSTYSEVVIELVVDNSLSLENITFYFDYESVGIAEFILNLGVSGNLKPALPEIENYKEVSLETIMLEIDKLEELPELAPKVEEAPDETE